jgi:hypothetical protein
LDTCRQRGVRFIVGHPLQVGVATALIALGEDVWQPAITADGSDWRDVGEICEITDHVDLSGWPQGTRMIARREQPHDGAQLTFTDLNGYRYQVCVTDLQDSDLAFLEALYRARGRMEQRICDIKATAAANLPSHSFAINQAWLTLVMIAQDLMCWTQHLGLDSELARAEPKRLRFCLFHAAAVIARTARRTILRIARTGRGPANSPQHPQSNIRAISTCRIVWIDVRVHRVRIALTVSERYRKRRGGSRH